MDYDHEISNTIENFLNTVTLGRNPFFGADSLWESFQDKINGFTNTNGGVSKILKPITNRPDWGEVKDVLNGKKPISDLRCK